MKATSAVPATADQSLPDASVPSRTSPAPTTMAPAYARALGIVGPPKSAKPNRAKVPKTANAVAAGLPTMVLAKAAVGGTTIATRAARRSDAPPGSRARTAGNAPRQPPAARSAGRWPPS